MPDQEKNQKIIVFDGVCVLCSRWVGFLIKRDRKRIFQFTAMQSDTGRRLLVQAALDPDDPSSFILIEVGEILRQTDAISAVLKELSGPWPAVGALMLAAPRAIRDWFYFRIARNRYRLFGQRDVCYVPAPQERDRFIL